MDWNMRSASSRRKGRPQLEQLRAKIRDMAPGALPALSTPPGVQGQASGEVHNLLDLQTGLHEICPQDYLDTPSALAVQTGFFSQALRRQNRARPIVWVRRTGGRSQDFGQPYPLALRQWGLPPDRILLVEASETVDTLWAMEEALNAGAWLMGEIGSEHRYDLTASKRLHMAAQAHGALALILRSHDRVQPSAALTRWRISARPSPAEAWRGATGLPGMGAPCFRAQLERARGGPPRSFDIEWKHAAFHVLEPAPLANRPATDLPPAPAQRQIA